MGEEMTHTGDETRRADYIYMVNGKVMIVSMNTELDHHLAEEMRDVVDEIIEKRSVCDIIFDFGRITFMDSAGIGLIMGRFKKLSGKGGIYVAGTNESIDRILLISGLHKIITRCADINAAMRVIEGKRA